MAASLTIAKVAMAYGTTAKAPTPKSLSPVRSLTRSGTKNVSPNAAERMMK